MSERDLSLRPLSVEDAAAMTVVLADDSLYRFTGGSPPTEEELDRRYSAQVRGISPDGSEIWINRVVTLGCKPIGYVQATLSRDGGIAEVAWVIGVPWQSHGYAKRAIRLLLDELAGRGVSSLVAHIHPDHMASQRVAESIGLLATDETNDGEVRWVGPVY